jgi:hypothetical protein
MASDDFNWTQACMAPAYMSDDERALRDLFVKEYLVDYNPVSAAMRCGFLGSFAADYAKKLMDEPYVQQKLRDMQFEEPTSDKEQDNEESVHKRKIIMALMREAHNMYNSGSARVAALGKLAGIYGMDVSAKSDPAGEAHRGGVMQVPAIADINAWESAAMDSQTKLVTEARSETA